MAPEFRSNRPINSIKNNQVNYVFKLAATLDGSSKRSVHLSVPRQVNVWLEKSYSSTCRTPHVDHLRYADKKKGGKGIMADNSAKCKSSSIPVGVSTIDDILNMVIQAKRNAPVSPSSVTVRSSVNSTICGTSLIGNTARAPQTTIKAARMRRMTCGAQEVSHSSSESQVGGQTKIRCKA